MGDQRRPGHISVAKIPGWPARKTATTRFTGHVRGIGRAAFVPVEGVLLKPRQIQAVSLMRRWRRTGAVVVGGYVASRGTQGLWPYAPSEVRSPVNPPQPRTLARSTQRRPARRTAGMGKCLSALLLSVFVLISGSTVADAGQTVRPTLHSSARAGELPIPAGRRATQGPIGLNPSTANGLQLDVLSGLLNDAPVFNGDFADPFALRTTDVLYLYASNTEATQYSPGAHVPVIALSRDSGFEGRYMGDAPANPSEVDGLRLPMGAVGVGTTRWHLRHVLLHAGDHPTRVPRKVTSVGMRHDHPWAVERHVHLAGDKCKPGRTVRR